MNNTDNTVSTKLTPEEERMIQKNDVMEQDLDPSAHFHTLEVNSLLTTSDENYLDEAKSLFTELTKEDTFLTDSFNKDPSMVFNPPAFGKQPSISILFTTKEKFTNAQVDSLFKSQLDEIEVLESLIDNYDEQATWSIYPTPLQPLISDLEAHIEDYPSNVISSFTQLENPDSPEIRYTSIGVNSKKGFDGLIIDYVGGGEYQEFHYINGNVLVNNDDSTEDQFHEEFSRIHGTNLLKRFNTVLDSDIKWNSDFNPVSSADLKIFDGNVKIENYPATPDPANTIFNDEIRASILISSLLNPSELQSPITLSNNDDALSAISEAVYLDYISSPDFNFNEFITNVVDLAFTYGSNHFLHLQGFISSYRATLDFNDVNEYGFQRYYGVTDESELVLLGIFESTEDAMANHNREESMSLVLTQSDASGFVDSCEMHIANSTTARVDSEDGELYPSHEVSDNNNVIEFSVEQLMQSAGNYYDSVGSENIYEYPNQTKRNKKSKIKSR